MRTAIKEGNKGRRKRGIKLTKKFFNYHKRLYNSTNSRKCNIEESEVKEILE